MLSHASLNRSIHLHTPTIDNNNCSTISATEVGMDNNSTTVGATEVGMDNNRHKTTAIDATEVGMDNNRHNNNNSTTVGATEVGMDNNRHKTTAEPSVQQKYAWAITTNREQKLQAVSVTR